MGPKLMMVTTLVTGGADDTDDAGDAGDAGDHIGEQLDKLGHYPTAICLHCQVHDYM